MIISDAANEAIVLARLIEDGFHPSAAHYNSTYYGDGWQPSYGRPGPSSITQAPLPISGDLHNPLGTPASLIGAFPNVVALPGINYPSISLGIGALTSNAPVPGPPGPPGPPGSSTPGSGDITLTVNTTVLDSPGEAPPGASISTLDNMVTETRLFPDAQEPTSLGHSYRPLSLASWVTQDGSDFTLTIAPILEPSLDVSIISLTDCATTQNALDLMSGSTPSAHSAASQLHGECGCGG
jgi:hypothetical protein